MTFVRTCGVVLVLGASLLLVAPAGVAAVSAEGSERPSRTARITLADLPPTATAPGPTSPAPAPATAPACRDGACAAPQPTQAARQAQDVGSVQQQQLPELPPRDARSQLEPAPHAPTTQPVRADRLLHFAATTPHFPYESSFYESGANGGDGHEDASVAFPTGAARRAYKYRDAHPDAAEQYNATLTTPRIDLFDRHHARVAESIRQNLEELEEQHGVLGTMPPPSPQPLPRSEPTAATEVGINDLISALPKNDTKVALEYTNHVSVHYNLTADPPRSQQKDVVVENGTHMDFTSSYVHSEIFPDDATTQATENHVPRPTDNATSASPATKPISSNDTHDQTAGSAKVVEKTKEPLSINSAEDVENSVLRNSSSLRRNSNKINNIRVTPGDIQSTTTGGAASRSQEPTEAAPTTIYNEVISTAAPTKTSRARYSTKRLKMSGVTTTSKTTTPLAGSTTEAVATTAGADLREEEARATTLQPPPTTNARPRTRGRMISSRRAYPNTTNSVEEPPTVPPAAASLPTLRKKPTTRYSWRRPGSTPGTTAGPDPTGDAAPANASAEEPGLVRVPVTTVNPVGGSGSVASRRPALPRRTLGSSEAPAAATPTPSSATLRRFLAARRRLSTTTSEETATQQAAGVVDGPRANRTRGRPAPPPTTTTSSTTSTTKRPAFATRARGSVRFGATEDADEEAGTGAGASGMSIPPTAAAWLLATLHGPAPAADQHGAASGVGGDDDEGEEEDTEPPAPTTTETPVLSSPAEPATTTTAAAEMEAETEASSGVAAPAPTAPAPTHALPPQPSDAPDGPDPTATDPQDNDTTTSFTTTDSAELQTTDPPGFTTTLAPPPPLDGDMMERGTAASILDVDFASQGITQTPAPAPEDDVTTAAPPAPEGGGASSASGDAAATTTPESVGAATRDPDADASTTPLSAVADADADAAATEAVQETTTAAAAGAMAPAPRGDSDARRRPSDEPEPAAEPTPAPESAPGQQPTRAPSSEATPLPEDTATTATTLPAPGDGEAPTPTAGAAAGAEEGDSGAVNTFLRITVQTSWEVLCRDREAFRVALAHMATERFDKNVSVVVAGLGSGAGAAECERMHVDSTGETRLLPVTVYLLDERGRFDKALVESFYMVVSQPQQPSPLQITRVDLMYGPLPTTSSDSNAGVIAAITISCVGAICLLLLAALLIIMRKRQKRFNYGQRCTPVSLDAYSLDSVSVYDSVRRKGALRASKRSYGNPAFDDPGAPSHPMNFAGLANFSSDRAALEEEFEMVPQVTPKSDELPEGAETKNRYSNVIPLPETRVQLSVVEGEQLSDYINANYVKGPKNETKFYIACQAPLPSTVTDFWRMIWEQQSKVILMLTDLVENGVEKCADYMPPSEVLDCHRLFGDFQITLKKREEREKYIISTLQLKNLETNSWREVTHLWYLSWPHQGVPDESNSIIAFLIEARPYMRSNTGPTVVHCSPGTGRTGTVLACDICIRDFEQTRMVDIPRCVYRLRRDRAGTVKTKDQYVFIYQVLNTYATKLTGGGGSLDSI